MSTNLYYNTISKNKNIGYAIKWILAPLIWEHDGSLGSEPTYINKDSEFYMNDKSIRLYDFLLGLTNKNDEIGKEAKILVDLLDKYDDGIEIQLMA